MKALLLEFFADNYVILMMIVLLLVILHVPTPAGKSNRTSYLIVVLTLVLTIFSHIELHNTDFGLNTEMRLLVNYICYVIKPTLLLLFLNYVVDVRSRIYLVSTGLVVINALIYATTFFSGIVFSYDADGNFIRGPLGYTLHVVSVTLMLICFVVTIRKFRDWYLSYGIMLVTVAVLIMVSAAIETFDFTKNYLNAAILLGCITHYIYIHIQYARIVNENQERKLEDQGNALMISQIQPHFMYNTLNTIYYLCTQDPPLAAETVRNFSGYLRDNLDVGNHSVKLVSIASEIEHTKRYTEIEKLRFSQITVEYDIRCTSFKVPPLSIQPMVENAIRHGIRGKEDGKVIIRTFEEEENYVVQIEDNGIGYMRPKKDLQKKSHIGIANVKERLENIAGGTFQIEMVRDVGTTVTMKIPKSGGKG